MIFIHIIAGYLISLLGLKMVDKYNLEHILCALGGALWIVGMFIVIFSTLFYVTDFIK